VTWMLNEGGQGYHWRMYEQLYFKLFSGGAAVFVLTSYLSVNGGAIDFNRNPEFRDYIQGLERKKILMMSALMLPGILTHIVPVVFIFPYHFFSFAALVITAVSALLRWKISSLRYKPKAYYAVNALSFALISFSLVILFQTFFVWSSLFYASPSQYLAIPRMEWSMRSTECYLIPLQDSYQRGLDAASRKGVFTYISLFYERIEEWLTFIFV
jgi:hypothetical protein